MPSFILIHPAVWPQRSDSIGRTGLQTVAQKWLNWDVVWDAEFGWLS